ENFLQNLIERSRYQLGKILFDSFHKLTFGGVRIFVFLTYAKERFTDLLKLFSFHTGVNRLIVPTLNFHIEVLPERFFRVILQEVSGINLNSMLVQIKYDGYDKTLNFFAVSLLVFQAWLIQYIIPFAHVATYFGTQFNWRILHSC